jgi:hypothetical protein
MIYCCIYHTEVINTHDVFHIIQYKVGCNKCIEKLTNAISYNGTYLNVIREWYNRRYYIFNNETDNKITNKNYPDHPYNNQNINSELHLNKKYKNYYVSIMCPINNRKYYINNKHKEKIQQIFYKLRNATRRILYYISTKSWTNWWI